jgi:ferric-dicitrate binding protein FerR (iron transport regulator)
VNGSEARDSTAIFSGDLLETKPGFSATLNLDGSEILLAPEAVAKFNGDSLELDHGSVSVGTSKSFKVKVKCITVVPALSEWTQYEVSDLNGTVQVAARKGDVNVEVGVRGANSTETGGLIHEGQQKSYDETVCGEPQRPTTAGLGNSPKWIAAAAGATGILLWIILHGTGGQPASPSQP